jgi:hypothetical protein
MQPYGEHRVASGPLAVRWLSYELEPPRAGALARVRVRFVNAGREAWVEGRMNLAYHWLDELGNPIVWDGLRTPLDQAVAPGDELEAHLDVRAPIPPGRYRLALDLVAENFVWFAEVGGAALETDQEVGLRISRRALAVRVRSGPPQLESETAAALGALEEPLAPEDEAVAVAELAAGTLPAPDWSRRILDAHEEGFAIVGGAVEPVAGPLRMRHARTVLRAWAPGTGRNPAFGHPLLCASVLREVDVVAAGEVEGLPAVALPAEEPWLYDGRIVVRARLRSDRQRG